MSRDPLLQKTTGQAHALFPLAKEAMGAIAYARSLITQSSTHPDMHSCPDSLVVKQRDEIHI